MSPMPVDLGWRDVALRLALTVVCATLFGFNREGHGSPAGLRTTILVCLAASVAMIQANLLLPTAFRAPDSFVTLDLMRLPLGILSGVGFLGAGVIFRRSDLVLGVTTAAILWIATVIGLCFGGGQLGLGIVATILGLVVLWGMKWLERYISHDHRAVLSLRTSSNALSSDEIVRMLEDAGYHVEGEAVHLHDAECEIHYDVRCHVRRNDPRAPGFVTGLATRAGVLDVRWRPQGIDEP